MPYQKTTYDNRAIADISRTALDNIENALRLGYHVLMIDACVDIMEILGDVAAFWPFMETVGEQSSDFGPNGYHLYTSLGAAPDLDAWDQVPEGNGIAMAYVFNGTDEYLIALDQAAFTVEAESVFSVGAWVSLDVLGAGAILTKWDETDLNGGEIREWKLALSTSGYPGLTIYDETNNAAIGREDQTSLPTNRTWNFIVGTYDGGTDAANIDVFVNGVELDDADIVDDAGFASMVNTSAVVRCGSYSDAAGDEVDLWDGRIWGPFFTLKQLSDDEIWNLYQLGKGILDLDLIGGQPK